MNSGEDLGHGVFVSLDPGGDAVVVSPRLDLGWRAAEGRAPGTAVLWRGMSFEVVGRVDLGRGARWTLRRWNAATAMRGVFRLDAGTVREIAERAAAEERGRLADTRVALAPARLQKKWADDWGFAAARATRVSAGCELLLGAFGVIQAATRGFGGEPILPSWLASLGFVLFGSGLARLALIAADGAPVGSPLGVPLLLVAPKPEPSVVDTTPELRSFDESGGGLVLASSVHRRDWDRDGRLRYRDGLYRLERTEQEGRTWVYHFVPDRDAREHAPQMKLRLQPTATGGDATEHPVPPSILRSTLVTAGVAMGPAPDQEAWASELGIRAVWLTALGAGAELIGGLANLRKDLGPDASLILLLDLFLVGEGLLRIGSVFAGRPMGSLIGWIVRPLYRRWLVSDRC